jgi:dolichyl-phosphate-mannose--protein O-mannosyl transferase
MESIMMSFGLAALLCVLKFRKVSVRPFSPAWFTWLTLSSLLLTCAFW